MEEEKMIDPVEFGKLVNAVETLKNDVERLTVIVESMNHEMSRGKGVVFGALMMAGGIGAGITKLLEGFGK